MKAPSPLLGYNNNVPHRGRMYHVQTEDSGMRRPHIITHLFADGGRVVTSQKTSYAEIVSDEDVADKVRELMREQHKGMVIALRDGAFDELLLDDGANASAPAGERVEPLELGGDVPAAVNPVEPEALDLADDHDAGPADPPLEEDVFALEPPGPAGAARGSGPALAQTIAWEDGVRPGVEIPVELLERLAAEAEREFYTEFRALLAQGEGAVAPEAAEASSPGTYRFIGRAGADAPRPARARTLAMEARPSIRRPGAGASSSLAPPSRGGPPRTPVMPDSAPDPFEDEDYAEHVSRQIERARIDRRTSEPAAAGQWFFGSSVMGEHRLDELVRQFLRDRGR